MRGTIARLPRIARELSNRTGDCRLGVLWTRACSNTTTPNCVTSASWAASSPAISQKSRADSAWTALSVLTRTLSDFSKASRFLAARVQLKMDSEFPQLVQNLLEIVYPHFLAPMPSMAVVQFEPDLTEGASGERLRPPAWHGATRQGCQRRTDGMRISNCPRRQLWPLEVTRADYFSRDVASIQLPYERARYGGRLANASAGCTGTSVRKAGASRICRFTSKAATNCRITLCEQCLAHAQALLISPVAEEENWHELLDKSNIRPMGFEANQALLPYELPSFHGYRLLSEYFAFRERFLFVELTNIGPALRRCTGSEVDLILLFNRAEAGVSHAVDKSNIALYCTPAVNLFPEANRSNPSG